MRSRFLTLTAVILLVGLSATVVGVQEASAYRYGLAPTNDGRKLW